MELIQSDVYDLYAQQLLPPILEVASVHSERLKARASQLVEALSDWGYTCPTGLEGTSPSSNYARDARTAAESIGCLAFFATLFELGDAMLADEEDRADKEWFRTRLLYNALVRPETLTGDAQFWDDLDTPEVTETRSDIVIEALNLAAARLVARLGPNVDDWRWGRVHTLTLDSPLALFGIHAFGNGPYANDGGMYTVDVAPPAEDFSHSSGAAVRLVHKVEADQIISYYQLAGGQDLHRRSPYYNSLVEKYLDNKMTRLPFGSEGFDPDSWIEVRAAPGSQ